MEQNFRWIQWIQQIQGIWYMHLAGTVVASWSLAYEVAGSSFFTVISNMFVAEFSEFNENI